MSNWRVYALTGVLLAQIWSWAGASPNAAAQDAVPISTSPTTATVRGSGVVIRTSPDMASQVLVELAPGAPLSVTGVGQKVGFLGWWEVQDPETGAKGWVRWEFLAGGVPGQFHPDGPPIPTPLPTQAPTPVPTASAPSEPAPPPPAVPPAVPDSQSGEAVPPAEAPPADGGQGKREPSPDFEQLIADGSADVNRYWRQTGNALGWKYQPPNMVTIKSQTMSACGPMESAGSPAFCGADLTVYLGVPFFEEHASGAPYFVSTVIAHEIAHYVQQAAGIDNSPFPQITGGYYTIQTELHADCLSGAFMAWDVSRSGTKLEEVYNAALITLIKFGDPPWTPLTDPNAHGSGEQRLGAIDLGVQAGSQSLEAGIKACGDLLFDVS